MQTSSLSPKRLFLMHPLSAWVRSQGEPSWLLESTLYVERSSVEDLLEYQRIGLYPERTRNKAWALISVLLDHEDTTALIATLLGWPEVEIQLFIRQAAAFKLSGWTMGNEKSLSEMSQYAHHLRRDRITKSFSAIILALLKKNPSVVRDVLSLDDVAMLLTDRVVGTDTNVDDVDHIAYFLQYIVQHHRDQTESIDPAQQSIAIFLHNSDIPDELDRIVIQICTAFKAVSETHALSEAIGEALQKDSTLQSATNSDATQLSCLLGFVSVLLSSCPRAAESFARHGLLRVLGNLITVGTARFPRDIADILLDDTNPIHFQIHRAFITRLASVTQLGDTLRNLAQGKQNPLGSLTDALNSFIEETWLESEPWICLPLLESINSKFESKSFRSIYRVSLNVLALGTQPPKVQVEQLHVQQDSFELDCLLELGGTDLSKLSKDKTAFVLAPVLAFKMKGNPSDGKPAKFTIRLEDIKFTAKFKLHFKSVSGPMPLQMIGVAVTEHPTFEFRPKVTDGAKVGTDMRVNLQTFTSMMIRVMNTLLGPTEFDCRKLLPVFEALASLKETEPDDEQVYTSPKPFSDQPVGLLKIEVDTPHNLVAMGSNQCYLRAQNGQRPPVTMRLAERSDGKREGFVHVPVFPQDEVVTVTITLADEVVCEGLIPIEDMSLADTDGTSMLSSGQKVFKLDDAISKRASKVYQHEPVHCVSEFFAVVSTKTQSSKAVPIDEKQLPAQPFNEGITPYDRGILSVCLSKGSFHATGRFELIQEAVDVPLISIRASESDSSETHCFAKATTFIQDLQSLRLVLRLSDESLSRANTIAEWKCDGKTFLDKTLKGPAIFTLWDLTDDDKGSNVTLESRYYPVPYPTSKEALSVHLLHGRLTAIDQVSHQFSVAFSLNGKRVYKSQIAGSTNLVWNEKFDVKVDSDLTAILSVDLFEWEASKSRKISSKNLNLREPWIGEEVDIQLSLPNNYPDLELTAILHLH